MFQHTSLAEIKQMSKMETYSIASVHNISDRTALTRLRLSNHHLMIEKGRHQNITLVTNRTCPFCPSKVENEFHFLLKCYILFYLNTSLREALLKNIKATDEQFLFWLLLCCPGISQYTARYIKLAMELRAFLSENPKNPT